MGHCPILNLSILMGLIQNFMEQVGNLMGHVGNFIGKVGNPMGQAGNPWVKIEHSSDLYLKLRTVIYKYKQFVSV